MYRVFRVSVAAYDAVAMVVFCGRPGTAIGQRETRAIEALGTHPLPAQFFVS